jgi:prepilin signal peptidase PulO-like enzyme (type II secretory pathway)
MCPHCHHELAAKDLVPIFSWLWLRGRCRYCRKPISAQYPLVEALMAVLFVVSYVFWPAKLAGSEIAIFSLWLVLLIGLIALVVYDLKWTLLPNRILFPLLGVALVQAIIRIAADPRPFHALTQELLAVAIDGGIFYVLFQVSGGRWIGGGDVKLGWLLGLIVATAGKAVLVIFLASVLGTIVSLPLLAVKRLKRTSTIPFGPFLVAAAIIVVLFGGDILHWYDHTFLLMG